MELALALRHIWRHKLWLIPVGLAALTTALAVSYHLSLFPPSIKSESGVYGAASAKVLLNTPEPTSEHLEIPITRLGEQAAVYAQLLDTRPVRNEIGRLAHVPHREISISGESGESGEPGSAQRSSELISAGSPTSLIFGADGVQPFIQLYSKAPTAIQARRIVSSAVRALQNYVAVLEEQGHVPTSQRVTLQQLGPPEGGTIASGTGKVLGLLAGLLVFGLGCLLILLIPRLLLDIRRAAATEAHHTAALAQPSATQTETAMLNGDSGDVADPAHRHLDPG